MKSNSSNHEYKKDLNSAEAPRSLSRRSVLGTAGLALAGLTLATCDRRELTEWYLLNVEKDPDAIHRSYRSRNASEDIVIETQDLYPYDESTLLIYISEEKRLFADRSKIDQAIIIADNISNRVAAACYKLAQDSLSQSNRQDEATSLSMEEALRMMSSNENNLIVYAKLVAMELIRAQCIYTEESSLQNAVDPALHAGNFFHLDCDLLCHFALHAASRHNVALHAVNAPQHMYLGSPIFPELAIEMTDFRDSQEINRRLRKNGVVKYTDIRQIGNDFESSHEVQESRWRFATPFVKDRFGFFKPMTESGIRESAIGGLIADALVRAAKSKDIAVIEQLCEMADKELAQFEGVNLLAQNTYAAHSAAVDFYLEAWRVEKTNDPLRQAGLRHVKQIDSIKRSYGYALLFIATRDDENRWLELTTGINIGELSKRRELLNRLKESRGK
jgi:hypothetical protein